MARGFDSKSVSEQQEEMLRRREPKAAAAVVSPRRRTLELARRDLERRLEAAPARHRESLLKALTDLDELIRKA